MADKGALTFVAVMSMTCHFMLGLARRFLRIISAMTALEKSMLVMSSHPWSYLLMPQGLSGGPFQIKSSKW